MPKKKTKLDDMLKNSAMAFGGGVGAEFISDLIAENLPDQVADYPKLTEIAPAAVGVGLLYFMPGKADALAYGMIGASGAGLADDIIGAVSGKGMNGFNRLNLQGYGEQLNQQSKFINDKLNQGFQTPENYGDGMS